MAGSKKFQELNLSNAFLFGAFMGDRENCREVLEVLLGKPVARIRTVKTEEMFWYHPESHGIRLDIYAADREGTRYDVDMQTVDEHNLPLRSRYYQGKMDIVSLKPGEKYSDLKPLYIIFICAFDPFSEGLYRYTFQNICLETGKPLGDGVQKIFFNCLGKENDDTDGTLRHFLKYVVKSDEETAREGGDAFVSQIHARLEALKKDRQVEEKYMILEEWLERERNAGMEAGMEAGKAMGRQEGLQTVLELLRTMTEEGRTAEISRLYEDPTFLKKMLEQYGLPGTADADGKESERKDREAEDTEEQDIEE